MASNFEKFKGLHEQKDLLLLPNAWDARSAQLFQEQQFKAVATSSAAVAGSLGYEDGGNMPFSDYLFVIGRILSSIQVPLTVDMEMGYGADDKEIAANIVRIAEMGVSGINIEDSIIVSSKRVLAAADDFARTIEFVKSQLTAKNLSLFINIRCDTYLLNIKDKQEETIRRLKAYEPTGADGIFLPCIAREEDIAAAVQTSTLPVNVMVIPGLPGLDILNRLGVKRVSMGPFLYTKVYDNIAPLVGTIRKDKNFSSIL